MALVLFDHEELDGRGYVARIMKMKNAFKT
jgi:hypothetical protein